MADRSPPRNTGATFRAVLLGLLLIPLNCYWIMDGLMWGQSRPTTVSLFFNVVATLFLLVLANAVAAQFARRFALSHGELVVVYVLVCIGSALCSLDLMQPLVAIVAAPHWLAAPENRWEEIWLHSVPDYLVVTDLEVLEGFFGGHSTMWRPEVLRAWLPAFAVWGTFTLVLALGMLCINVLVRRDWTEKSKLSFPIVQLPLEMTRADFRLFRSKLMWVGFGVAAFVDLMNGLHFLHPVLPTLGGRLYDLRQHLPNRPWNAVGWTPMGLFPFGVGLGFFMPLDLAFSCWFFYLFWKAQRVFAAMTGWGDIPRFPYVEEQNFASYVAFCVYCLWVGRTHLYGVWLRICGKPGGVDDSQEPTSYRLAAVGLLVSLALLIGFSNHIGLSLWIAVVFFLAYFALSTAISRMRAEVGSPVHDLHLGGPHLLLANTLGSGLLGTKNLTVLSFYQFFNRAYRGHLMPHLLEGFKLGEETGVHQRRLAAAMVLAMVLGVAVSFISLVDVSYRFGAHYGYANETFGRLVTWVSSKAPPNYGSIGAVGIGTVITVLLMWLRLRFIWWPLHPAGFAVSGSWSMNLFWVSLMMAWVVKLCLIRYAGMQSYRKAMPFFMGLILGEFAVGSFWGLYGCLTQKPMYNFLP